MDGQLHGIAKPFSQDWSLPDWNEALLRHFFSAGTDPSPVSRLYVTTDGLKAAAGASDITPEQARELFISMIRKTIGSRSLGTDAANRSWRWTPDSPQIPDFLSHLLLTCMVANDLAEELLGIGDFRRRLTKVLGSGTLHGLDRMKRLWLDLSEWLLKQSAAPFHCRPLLLPSIPESGPFCIIGHPMRLAFPSRKDQLTLKDLLKSQPRGLEEMSNDEIVSLIGRRLLSFSTDFQHVFDAFRRSSREVPPSALYNTPFWLAVLDVNAQIVGFAEELIDDASIRLEVQDDEGRFMFAFTSDREFETSSFTTSKIPASRISQYDYLIVGKSADQALVPTTLLFDESLRSRLSGVSPRLALKSMSEGFVMFEQSEDGVFEYASRLPASGDLIAIVHTRIREPLQRVLTRSRASGSFSSSDYPGWFELRGLRAEQLLGIDFSHDRLLVGVSCLRKVIPTPRIRIFGIKTDGGYLLAKAFMPSVEIADATSVKAIDTHGEIPLLRSPDDTNTWRFPTDSIERFEGSVRLVAIHGEQYLASRNIRFVLRAYSLAYKRPSDPARWQSEGGDQDLVSLQNESVAASTNRQKRFASVPVAQKPKEHHVKTAPTATLHEFLDALASIFARRSGVPEFELNELVGDAFNLPGPHVWPLLRSWEEQGMVDCVSDSQWRARAYYARPPELYSYRRGDKTIVVLRGLTPIHFVERFVQTTIRIGLVLLEREAPNPLVPIMQAVELTADSQGDQLASELNLGSPTPVLRPRALVRALTHPAQSGEVEPVNWETHKRWDWSVNRFVEHASVAERKGFGLDWCRRHDAPDYFKIKQSGLTRCWFRSKTWSLLYMYWLAGERAFDAKDSTIYPRSYGIYLPLPLARFSAIVGSRAPGNEANGDRGFGTYSYTFPNSRTLDQTLDALYRDEDSTSDMRLRRFVGTISAYGKRVVPLPVQLMQTLRSSLAAPQIGLSGVPDRALPQLYRLFKSAKSRG